jgi:hypothetical protein
MMDEDDDMQFVESIGGINGTPLASDVQSVHMHGYVGASSIVVVVVVVVSNFTIVASNFAEV